MRTQRAFVFIAIVVCLSLSRAKISSAAVTGLDSISQVTNGTTLDFEGVPVHSNPNIPLAPYGITTDSNDVTMFVHWVTGNADAPIGGEAVFSATLFTTGTPWWTVGFATVSTLIGPSESFNFSAFDQQDNLIYADSHVFAPAISPQDIISGEPAYNAAAFFFGVTSDTPIYSVALSSSNPNYAIDSFTFVSAPEPSTTTVMVLAPALAILRRRRAIA